MECPPWRCHNVIMGCSPSCTLDVGAVAEEKCHFGDPRDQIITAMCTGLDTVWIGLAGGHITACVWYEPSR